VKVCWLLILIVLLPNYSRGQEPDSVIVAADSVYSYLSHTLDDIEDSRGAADSFPVKLRSFDSQSLEELKADPDLSYRETPTVAESLWDRLLALLGDFIDSLFRNAMSTDWGRVFSFAIGLVVIVALIMMLLRVNAFKIFYKGEGESVVPYNVLDENIHEMNFDSLIAEAVAKNDFRTGIRLLFLKGLKILADKNFVQWEHGKTNHDYLAELKKDELKKGFNELNYYFEYAWYGNFSVNYETFKKVQQIFTDWSGRIR
jgi:hypothetical protein